MKTAKTVWIFYSLCAIIPVIAAFFVPEHQLLRATPTCYSIKQFGRECFMCGSTRSFILVADGKLAEAAKMNKLAVALFFLVVANTVVLIYYLLYLKLYRT